MSPPTGRAHSLSAPPSPQWRTEFPANAGKFAVLLYLFSLSLPFYSPAFLLILSAAGILVCLAGTPKLTLHLREHWPLWAFLVSALVSSFVSVNLHRTLLLSLSFLPGLLLFFLILSLFPSDSFHLLARTFSILALLISVNALWTAHSFPGNEPAEWIRKMGNPCLVVPNDLVLLPILLPFMASDILKKSHLFFRLLSLLAILFSIAAVTAYQSRGGLILILLGLSLVCLFYTPRLFLPIAGTALALGLLVDFLLGAPLFQKITGAWHSRLPPWLAAWEMFADAPWIGHGPRAFGELYAQYQRQLQLPEWLFLDKRNMPWAHNLYLETLAEQGIIGLLFLLLFLGKLLLSLWKKIKARTQAPPLHVKCAFGSLLVLLVAGMFELSFIRLWFVVLFFALSAIIAILTMPNHPEGAP